MLERYWLFAAICLVVGLLVLRLVLRERLTLQSSLAFLGFLGGLGLLALLPEVGGTLAERLGFAVPSNFFFAVSIAGLAILHLTSLIALSRLELRTVTVVQELAILRAELERRVPPSTVSDVGDAALKAHSPDEAVL